VFFQDHSFFGDLYGTYEDAYDATVERMIGLGQAPNLTQLQLMATEKLKATPTENIKENSEFYKTLLLLEKAARDAATSWIQSGKCSEGTKNMLAQFCDDSEVRCYKMGQRVKK
jgi:DNA-binding ferritin-like protein